MNRILLLLVLLPVALSGCHSMEKNPSPFSRKPANTEELIQGSQLVLNDLLNPRVFNASTCASYAEKIVSYMYSLPADHFIPKNRNELELLKSRGPEVIDTIFQIRLTLRNRFQEFDNEGSLTRECTERTRQSLNYARFAEEYLLDFLYQQKVYVFKKTPILVSEKPSTWANPEFENFELKTGDVLLIRGKSYVSAMIAQIADQEGNFSHLAIVGEDSKGQKYIVESLIHLGAIVTPLEKWRQQEDSRVGLYRHKDQKLAQKAGRNIYDKVAHGKKSLRYDFAMDDSDYSSLFCSEVIRYAYDMASGGQLLVPKYRSTVSKFKNTEYPRSLGVTKSTLFAPYDIEVDSRFDFVAEYRFFPLLRQVRMQDAVLQSVYTWMIEKNYTFEFAPAHSIKAYFAKFVRQFGIAADTLPTYMPMDSLKTNVQFAAVATALEKNIYAKEEQFYKENGHLPSFQDMLAMNDDFRKKDCVLYQEYLKERRESLGKRDAQPKVRSSFHWFFSSPKKTCE